MSDARGEETLIEQLRHWADTKPDAPAVWGRSGGPGSEPAWRALSWSRYWQQVRDVAVALVDAGHEVGQCVAVVGDNRIGWVLAEFGIMAARGVVAPIYQTNTREQVIYLLGHSEARVAFADRGVQVKKLLSCIGEPDVKLERIVQMVPPDEQVIDDDRVIGLDDFMKQAQGASKAAPELDARVDAIAPADVALLIYTSGTTGQPKAVQIDHDNMCSISRAAVQRYPHIDGDAFQIISYLPLSHIAEQMFTNMVHMRTGGQVWFCDDLSAIRDYLVDVRPTVFVGVPRVWEKMHAAMEARLAQAPGYRRALAQWAMGLELEAFRRECETGQPVSSLRLSLARKLVIDKIKVGLGFDKLLIACSGAAPLAPSTMEFLASVGIVIHEGFGMSETSGAVTAPPYRRPRVGYVGTALEGVEIKIAEDGEICLRGRPMTRGYMGMPDKTAELIDDEGWLHTGDLGRIDDGYLAITGRKKDILITAGGKNVAPVKIESLLKRIAGVGQAVVIGDKAPYLSALLVLDPEAVADLKRTHGLPEATTPAELAAHDALRKAIQRAIDDEVNPELARYETIKKFAVLADEFTVDGGELTPTMKIKRNVVNDKYAAVIEGLYAK